MVALVTHGVLAAADPPPITARVALDGGIVPDEQGRDGGSFSSDWELVETRLFWRSHPAVRLGLGLGASRDAYHGDQLPLPDEVHHIWIRVPLVVMFHPHWGVTAQGSLGTGYSADSSPTAGRQWQVQGGPFYRGSDDLIVALLVNISSRIEEAPTIFAFPSLYWRFHHDWRLTVVDEVDTLSHLRWAIAERVDLGLRLDVRLREAALRGGAALSDERLAVALQTTWMPFGRDRAEVSPLIGAELIRRLAVRDVAGDERWSLVTRPALLVGVSVRASF